MALDPNHPLANLDPGFRLKEKKPDADPFRHIVLDVDIDKALANVVEGYKPIRDVIPRTEGRAEGWKLREHCLSAKARNWPGVKPFEFDGESIAICGGGPSLAKTLPELRELQRRGTKVLTINRTEDFLCGLPTTHGLPWIKPWGSALLEALPVASTYIKPRHGVRYFISSQCAPVTFDVFEKYEHRIWHCIAKPELNECLSPDELRLAIPPNGSTCGLRAILLAYTMGFRDIHLFGMDSSYSSWEIEHGILGADGAPKLHAYHKPEAIHDFKRLSLVDVDPEGKPTGGSTDFYGNGNMIAQADEFQNFIEWRDKMLKQRDIEPHNLVVHGEGAIPHIAAFYGLHFNKERNVKHERKAA